MGQFISLRNKLNGLLPNLKSNIYKPTTMVAKQNCVKLITINAPYDSCFHFLEVLMMINPNTQCQKLHSKKLPS